MVEIFTKFLPARISTCAEFQSVGLYSERESTAAFSMDRWKRGRANPTFPFKLQSYVHTASRFNVQKDTSGHLLAARTSSRRGEYPLAAYEQLP